MLLNNSRLAANCCSARWLLLELGVLLDYDSVLPSLLETSAHTRPAAAAVGAMDASPPALRSGINAHAADVEGASPSAPAPAAQAVQPLPGLAVAPVASNPLPLGRGPDHVEMSAAASAAMAGAGALSAVPYQHQLHAATATATAAEEAAESMLDPRGDGTLALRLLPSSGGESARRGPPGPASQEQLEQLRQLEQLQQEQQQQHPEHQSARGSSGVPYTVISFAPTGSDVNGSNAGRGARNSDGTEDTASISDDTLKVGCREGERAFGMPFKLVLNGFRYTLTYTVRFLPASHSLTTNMRTYEMH